MTNGNADDCFISSDVDEVIKTQKTLLISFALNIKIFSCDHTVKVLKKGNNTFLLLDDVSSQIYGVCF